MNNADVEESPMLEDLSVAAFVSLSFFKTGVTETECLVL